MRFSSHYYSLNFWRQAHLSIFRRTISVLMALTFTFPSLSWAFEPASHPGAILYHGQEVRVPERLAHLKEAFQGTAGPLVIYIQDLHCNYEVQSHISDLINQLAQDHGLKLVASEGASGDVDISPLSSFSQAWVKHEVGSYMMRQGKMTGTEFYAATGKHPVRLVGVESEALYEKNLSSALRILSYESQGYVLDLKEALDRLKPGIYSPALLKWDEARSAYRDNRKSLLEYASVLCRQSGRQGVDLKHFPNLEQYAVAGKISAEIDNDGLIQEIDHLESVLREPMYSRPGERQLDNLQSRLEIVEKLMAISATAEELAQFRLHPAEYRAEVFMDFIKQHAPAGEEMEDAASLNQWLDEALKFYQIADARSQAFVQNTLKAMQSQGTDLALMVTGGYHTQDILGTMKKQGISYICLQPVLTRQDVANPYLSILSGKLSPLEKFLAKNQNILSPRLAFGDLQHLALLKQSLAVLCGGITLAYEATQGAHTVNSLRPGFQTDARLQALAPQWESALADEKQGAFLVPMAGAQVAVLIRQQDRVLRHPVSLAQIELAGYVVELIGLDQIAEAKALLEAEGRALTVQGLDVQTALLASPLAALVGLSGTLAVAPTLGQRWLGKANRLVAAIRANLLPTSSNNVNLTPIRVAGGRMAILEEPIVSLFTRLGFSEPGGRAIYAVASMVLENYVAQKVLGTVALLALAALLGPHAITGSVALKIFWGIFVAGHLVTARKSRLAGMNFFISVGMTLIAVQFGFAPWSKLGVLLHVVVSLNAIIMSIGMAFERSNKSRAGEEINAFVALTITFASLLGLLAAAGIVVYALVAGFAVTAPVMAPWLVIALLVALPGTSMLLEARRANEQADGQEAYLGVVGTTAGTLLTIAGITAAFVSGAFGLLPVALLVTGIATVTGRTLGPRIQAWWAERSWRAQIDKLNVEKVSLDESGWSLINNDHYRELSKGIQEDKRLREGLFPDDRATRLQWQLEIVWRHLERIQEHQMKAQELDQRFRDLRQKVGLLPFVSLSGGQASELLGNLRQVFDEHAKYGKTQWSDRDGAIGRLALQQLSDVLSHEVFMDFLTYLKDQGREGREGLLSLLVGMSEILNPQVPLVGPEIAMSTGMKEKVDAARSQTMAFIGLLRREMVNKDFHGYNTERAVDVPRDAWITVQRQAFITKENSAFFNAYAQQHMDFLFSMNSNFRRPLDPWLYPKLYAHIAVNTLSRPVDETGLMAGRLAAGAVLGAAREARHHEAEQANMLTELAGKLKVGEINVSPQRVPYLLLLQSGKGITQFASLETMDSDNHNYDAASARGIRTVGVISAAAGAALLLAAFAVGDVTGIAHTLLNVVQGLGLTSLALGLVTALSTWTWGDTIQGLVGAGAIAANRGALSQQQLQGLGVIKRYHPGLYRAILIHETFASHFWGNVAMVPVLKWVALGLAAFGVVERNASRAMEIDTAVAGYLATAEGDRLTRRANPVVARAIAKAINEEVNGPSGLRWGGLTGALSLAMLASACGGTQEEVAAEAPEYAGIPGVAANSPDYAMERTRVSDTREIMVIKSSQTGQALYKAQIDQAHAPATVDNTRSTSNWTAVDDRNATVPVRVTGPDGNVLEMVYTIQGWWCSMVKDMSSQPIALAEYDDFHFFYQGTGAKDKLVVKVADGQGVTYGFSVPSGTVQPGWQEMSIHRSAFTYLFGGQNQAPINWSDIRKMEFTMDAHTVNGESTPFPLDKKVPGKFFLYDVDIVSQPTVKFLDPATDTDLGTGTMLPDALVTPDGKTIRFNNLGDPAKASLTRVGAAETAINASGLIVDKVTPTQTDYYLSTPAGPSKFQTMLIHNGAEVLGLYTQGDGVHGVIMNAAAQTGALNYMGDVNIDPAVMSTSFIDPASGTPVADLAVQLGKDNVGKVYYVNTPLGETEKFEVSPFQTIRYAANAPDYHNFGAAAARGITAAGVASAVAGVALLFAAFAAGDVTGITHTLLNVAKGLGIGALALGLLTAVSTWSWGDTIQGLMGAGAIAANSGKLATEQLRSLGVLKRYHPGLYQATLTHETFASHFWGNVAMVPVLGWAALGLGAVGLVQRNPARAWEIEAEVRGYLATAEGDRLTRRADPAMARALARVINEEVNGPSGVRWGGVIGVVSLALLAQACGGTLANAGHYYQLTAADKADIAKREKEDEQKRLEAENLVKEGLAKHDDGMILRGLEMINLEMLGGHVNAEILRPLLTSQNPEIRLVILDLAMRTVRFKNLPDDIPVDVAKRLREVLEENFYRMPAQTDGPLQRVETLRLFPDRILPEFNRLEFKELVSRKGWLYQAALADRLDAYAAQHNLNLSLKQIDPILGQLTQFFQENPSALEGKTSDQQVALAAKAAVALIQAQNEAAKTTLFGPGCKVLAAWPAHSMGHMHPEESVEQVKALGANLTPGMTFKGSQDKAGFEQNLVARENFLKALAGLAADTAQPATVWNFGFGKEKGFLFHPDDQASRITPDDNALAMMNSQKGKKEVSFQHMAFVLEGFDQDKMANRMRSRMEQIARDRDQVIVGWPVFVATPGRESYRPLRNHAMFEYSADRGRRPSLSVAEILHGNSYYWFESSLQIMARPVTAEDVEKAAVPQLAPWRPTVEQITRLEKVVSGQLVWFILDASDQSSSKMRYSEYLEQQEIVHFLRSYSPQRIQEALDKAHLGKKGLEQWEQVRSVVEAIIAEPHPAAAESQKAAPAAEAPSDWGAHYGLDTLSTNFVHFYANYVQGPIDFTNVSYDQKDALPQVFYDNLKGGQARALSGMKKMVTDFLTPDETAKLGQAFHLDQAGLIKFIVRALADISSTHLGEVQEQCANLGLTQGKFFKQVVGKAVIEKFSYAVDREFVVARENAAAFLDIEGEHGIVRFEEDLVAKLVLVDTPEGRKQGVANYRRASGQAVYAGIERASKHQGSLDYLVRAKIVVAEALARENGLAANELTPGIDDLTEGLAAALPMLEAMAKDRKHPESEHASRVIWDLRGSSYLDDAWNLPALWTQDEQTKVPVSVKRVLEYTQHLGNEHRSNRLGFRDYQKALIGLLVQAHLMETGMPKAEAAQEATRVKNTLVLKQNGQPVWQNDQLSIPVDFLMSRGKGSTQDAKELVRTLEQQYEKAPTRTKIVGDRAHAFDASAARGITAAGVVSAVAGAALLFAAFAMGDVTGIANTLLNVGKSLGIAALVLGLLTAVSTWSWGETVHGLMGEAGIATNKGPLTNEQLRGLGVLKQYHPGLYGAVLRHEMFASHFWGNVAMVPVLKGLAFGLAALGWVERNPARAGEIETAVSAYSATPQGRQLIRRADPAVARAVAKILQAEIDGSGGLSMGRITGGISLAMLLAACGSANETAGQIAVAPDYTGTPGVMPNSPDYNMDIVRVSETEETLTVRDANGNDLAKAVIDQAHAPVRVDDTRSLNGWTALTDSTTHTTVLKVTGPNADVLQLDYAIDLNWCALAKTTQIALGENDALHFFYEGTGAKEKLVVHVTDGNGIDYGFTVPAGTAAAGWQEITIPRGSFTYLYGGQANAPINWSDIWKVTFTLDTHIINGETLPFAVDKKVAGKFFLSTLDVVSQPKVKFVDPKTGADLGTGTMLPNALVTPATAQGNQTIRYSNLGDPSKATLTSWGTNETQVWSSGLIQDKVGAATTYYLQTVSGPVTFPTILTQNGKEVLGVIDNGDRVNGVIMNASSTGTLNFMGDMSLDPAVMSTAFINPTNGSAVSTLPIQTGADNVGKVFYVNTPTGETEKFEVTPYQLVRYDPNAPDYHNFNAASGRSIFTAGVAAVAAGALVLFAAFGAGDISGVLNTVLLVVKSMGLASAALGLVTIAATWRWGSTLEDLVGQRAIATSQGRLTNEQLRGLGTLKLDYPGLYEAVKMHETFANHFWGNVAMVPVMKGLALGLAALGLVERNPSRAQEIEAAVSGFLATPKGQRATWRNRAAAGRATALDGSFTVGNVTIGYSALANPVTSLLAWPRVTHLFQALAAGVAAQWAIAKTPVVRTAILLTLGMLVVSGAGLLIVVAGIAPAGPLAGIAGHWGAAAVYTFIIRSGLLVLPVVVFGLALLSRLPWNPEHIRQAAYNVIAIINGASDALARGINVVLLGLWSLYPTWATAGPMRGSRLNNYRNSFWFRWMSVLITSTTLGGIPRMARAQETDSTTYHGQANIYSMNTEPDLKQKDRTTLPIYIQNGFFGNETSGGITVSGGYMNGFSRDNDFGMLKVGGSTGVFANLNPGNSIGAPAIFSLTGGYVRRFDLSSRLGLALGTWINGWQGGLNYNQLFDRSSLGFEDAAGVLLRLRLTDQTRMFLGAANEWYLGANAFDNSKLGLEPLYQRAWLEIQSGPVTRVSGTLIHQPVGDAIRLNYVQSLSDATHLDFGLEVKETGQLQSNKGLTGAIGIGSNGEKDQPFNGLFANVSYSRSGEGYGVQTAMFNVGFRLGVPMDGGRKMDIEALGGSVGQEKARDYSTADSAPGIGNYNVYYDQPNGQLRLNADSSRVKTIEDLQSLWKSASQNPTVAGATDQQRADAVMQLAKQMGIQGDVVVGRIRGVDGNRPVVMIIPKDGRPVIFDRKGPETAMSADPLAAQAGTKKYGWKFNDLRDNQPQNWDSDNTNLVDELFDQKGKVIARRYSPAARFTTAFNGRASGDQLQGHLTDVFANDATHPIATEESYRPKDKSLRDLLNDDAWFDTFAGRLEEDVRAGKLTWDDLYTVTEFISSYNHAKPDVRIGNLRHMVAGRLLAEAASKGWDNIDRLNLYLRLIKNSGKEGEPLMQELLGSHLSWKDLLTLRSIVDDWYGAEYEKLKADIPAAMKTAAFEAYRDGKIEELTDELLKILLTQYSLEEIAQHLVPEQARQAMVLAKQKAAAKAEAEKMANAKETDPAKIVAAIEAKLADPEIKNREYGWEELLILCEQIPEDPIVTKKVLPFFKSAQDTFAWRIPQASWAEAMLPRLMDKNPMTAARVLASHQGRRDFGALRTRLYQKAMKQKWVGLLWQVAPLYAHDEAMSVKIAQAAVDAARKNGWLNYHGTDEENDDLANLALMMEEYRNMPAAAEIIRKAFVENEQESWITTGVAKWTGVPGLYTQVIPQYQNAMNLAILLQWDYQKDSQAMKAGLARLAELGDWQATALALAKAPGYDAERRQVWEHFKSNSVGKLSRSEKLEYLITNWGPQDPLVRGEILSEVFATRDRTLLAKIAGEFKNDSLLYIIYLRLKDDPRAVGDMAKALGEDPFVVAVMLPQLLKDQRISAEALVAAASQTRDEQLLIGHVLPTLAKRSAEILVKFVAEFPDQDMTKRALIPAVAKTGNGEILSLLGRACFKDTELLNRVILPAVAALGQKEPIEAFRALYTMVPGSADMAALAGQWAQFQNRLDTEINGLRQAFPTEMGAVDARWQDILYQQRYQGNEDGSNAILALRSAYLSQASQLVLARVQAQDMPGAKAIWGKLKPILAKGDGSIGVVLNDLLTAGQPASAAAPVVLAAPGKAVVVHATDKTFDAEVMNAKVPVLVDFYADWCGPCKMMAPELQKLAEKYPGGIKVVKVNAEENPGMADRYQVHAYPTLVLFNHGQKLQQESGARNLDGLVSWVQAKVKLSSGSAVVVAKPAADSATPVTTQTAREIEALAVELLNSPELKNATGNAILGQAMGNWAEQLLNRISGQAAPVGQDLQNLALASTLAAHNKAALTRDRSYEATEKTLLPALQKVTDKTSYVQMVSALAGVLSHIPLNATEENDKANGGRFNEEKRYAPLRDQLVTGLRNLLKQGPAWSDDVEVLRATLLLQPFLQIAVNLPKTPEKMVALLNDPDIAVQREAAALVPQTAEANPALLQADGPNQALWKSFAGFTQQLVTEGHQSQGNGLRAENLDYMLAMARTTLLAIMHNPKLADTLFAKDENMRHLFHDALILSSKLRLGQDQTRLDPFWLDMQKLIDRADLNASQRNSFGGLVFDYLCARIAIQSALDKYHVGKLADRTKIRDEIYSHLAGPRVDTSNVAGEARVVANEVSVDFGVRKEGARFLDPDTLFDALTTVEHEIGHTTGKFYWELGPAKDLANRTLETMVGPDKVDDRSLFGSEVRSITVVRLGFVRYQSNYEDILRSRDTKSVRLPWTSGRSDFPAQGLKAFQSDRPLFQIYTEMFNAHPEMDPQIQLLYLLLKGEKLEEPNLVDPAKVKTWSDVTRQLRSLEKQGEAYLPGSMWSGYLVGGVGVDSGDIWHTPEIAAELMTKIAFQFEPAVAESIAYATADFMQKGPVRVDMAAAIRKAVPDADPGMVDKWLEHYTRTWSRGQLAYSPEQTRSVLRQVLAKRLGKAAKDITDEVLLKQAARADVKAAAQLLAEQLRQSWKQSQAPQQMQKAIPDSYLPVANPGLPADLIQEMIIQHLRAKDDPPLFVQQETKLPAQTKIAGAEATTKEHGYGIAAARVSRSLQIVLGVLVQIALALLSSPLGDLAKGDWGSFAWKAGVMVLAALFSLVSVAVAQNRVWMIKNYMPQGELAVSVGPLSEGQLAALAKLKNSPWPVEQRLYQLILLHESYQSHFFGTLVMNPVMGRFFQWFLPPDNYLVDRGSLVLRGQAIDRAVAEYSQKTEAQVASVQIPERGATGLGIEPQGQQPGVRWNEPILYRLPGWLQFRPILYLSLFFQGLRLNPFRQFSRSLAGAPILPGSRNEINAQLALSPTLRAIIETVVPQIPAEIQKVGRVSIQPVAARKVGDLFLGNHRLVTGQHPELVLQLPGSILNALLWGETSSATPEELSRYAQARELAMMIVANQVRLYCRETTGVTQKTMASKYSYSAIDQDLAAKLEEQQPKVWEKGDALSEKEALVKRLESGRINITRTELTAYFRELMRDVDQAMAGIYLPADAQLASIRKARRTDQVDRGRSELYDALKARLEAGEDITADALLNILQMHAFDNDVQLALLNLQLKNARSALAAAQTPAERRQAQQALRETENGIVYNMMGLLAVSRPALTMEEADFVSKSRAQEVNVESLNPVEKGEILKALDRATEGLKFSSDEATKQALNARIVALRNALLLSQFMSYNPADAKQVLVKGVMAARLGMAGATVELSNTATHLEKPNGSRVYLAVAGQKEVTTKAGVISTPTLLEINTKADIGAISAQVKQGAVHVESDGAVREFARQSEIPALVKENVLGRSIGTLVLPADVVLSGILRLLGLHQWAGALSFWLRELAYKNAPSLVLGRVIAKLKQDKSMAIVLSQSQLKPYLPQDGQSLSDYLNSSDPLPTALRALALHPSPQTRDQVSKTLLRIIRPHQLTAWNGALMESNTADWLVFSAFIGNMGCIPSVEIAQATNHVVWTKAGFTSFSQVKLAVPAVLLNLRGTRGWLGFVTDRLSHPDSPFEVRQDVIDMFLRRGIMRFSSAA